MKIDFEYQKALSIAQELVDLLSPFCDKCLIAGSVRRKKAMVGDIEIVADVKDVNKFSLALFERTQFGFKRDARYTKIHYKGIQVDLFTPKSYDFWRMFVIRTGSADYSYKIIASAWRKLGWVGTDRISSLDGTD